MEVLAEAGVPLLELSEGDAMGGVVVSLARAGWHLHHDRGYYNWSSYINSNNNNNLR